MAAAAALKAFQGVVAESNQHVVYSSPEMIPAWQPSFDARLEAAARSALDAGTDPARVFRALDAAASVDLDRLPDKYLAICVDAGLSPDMDMGGESLLHLLLNHPFPPPLKLPLTPAAAAPAPAPADAQRAEQRGGAGGAEALAAALRSAPLGRNPAAGSATLNELLARRPKPNLEDAAGNTALHMLVACMVQRVHFPDPKLPGGDDEEPEGYGDGGEGEDGEDEEAAAARAAARQRRAQDKQREQEEQRRRQQQQQQQPGGADVQRLEDHDAARAAYALAGFRLLVAAGWHPAWRNFNGYSVRDLLEAGLARYQTELADLQDPDGVAQTTVALLSEKAPERDLKGFLDRKIVGVQAVVGALLEMHSAASAADAPRRSRSAASLVALWLALLAAAVYWLVWRRGEGGQL